MNFDLISLPLALEATELVSEPVTQMALELINKISFQSCKRDKRKSYILFHVTTTTTKFQNDGEMMLKSF